MPLRVHQGMIWQRDRLYRTQVEAPVRLQLRPFRARAVAILANSQPTSHGHGLEVAAALCKG